MKVLLFLAGSVIVVWMGHSRIDGSLPDQVDKQAFRQARQKISVTPLICAPNWSARPVGEDEIHDMILLPGTGSHSWKITTSSDSAQLYFNQGINLYYGLHILEALPSFKKALRFDSTAAMLYWAVALAYGPNINDMGYLASPDALLAVSKAKEYISNTTWKERELIDAVDAHYSLDSSITRSILNQRYADKMHTLYSKNPTDVEIGTLYADALMNLHPWDFWQQDGHPKAWTPELMHLLEKMMSIDPNHPGANHYYIHTMEASPLASKAILSADKLGRLTPGLSHMVHMPSHIYIRTGEYNKGRMANTAAVKSYYLYKKLFPSVLNGAFLYEYHNLHMQAASSMNTDYYFIAIQDALDCRDAIDSASLSAEAPFGNYVQYMYMTPAFTMMTFEKWNEILIEPLIESRYHYGKLIQEFARGMAFAHTGNLSKAKSSLASMDSLLSEKDMAVILAPFNAPITGGTVAKYILMGTIAEKENKPAEAIQYFTKAVATEGSLIYQEPRDWLVPARHYLGNALLKRGKFAEAEKVFLKDLVYQPNNAISTTGLRKARRK